MVKYHRLRFYVATENKDLIKNCEMLGCEKFHVYQELGDYIRNQDEHVVWQRDITGIPDCSSLDSYFLDKTERKYSKAVTESENKQLHDKYINFLSFMKDFKKYDFVLGNIEDKFNVSIHVKPNPIKEYILLEIYNADETKILASPKANYKSKNIVEKIAEFLGKKIPKTSN